jgi:hypothetical protein
MHRPAEVCRQVGAPPLALQFRPLPCGKECEATASLLTISRLSVQSSTPSDLGLPSLSPLAIGPASSTENSNFGRRACAGGIPSRRKARRGPAGGAVPRYGLGGGHAPTLANGTRGRAHGDDRFGRRANAAAGHFPPREHDASQFAFRRRALFACRNPFWAKQRPTGGGFGGIVASAARSTAEGHRQTRPDGGHAHPTTPADTAGRGQGGRQHRTAGRCDAAGTRAVPRDHDRRTGGGRTAEEPAGAGRAGEGAGGRGAGAGGRAVEEAARIAAETARAVEQDGQAAGLRAGEAGSDRGQAPDAGRHPGGAVQTGGAARPGTGQRPGRPDRERGCFPPIRAAAAGAPEGIVPPQRHQRNPVHHLQRAEHALQRFHEPEGDGAVPVHRIRSHSLAALEQPVLVRRPARGPYRRHRARIRPDRLDGERLAHGGGWPLHDSDRIVQRSASLPVDQQAPRFPHLRLGGGAVRLQPERRDGSRLQVSLRLPREDGIRFLCL